MPAHLVVEVNENSQDLIIIFIVVALCILFDCKLTQELQVKQLYQLVLIKVDYILIDFILMLVLLCQPLYTLIHTRPIAFQHLGQ